MNVSSASLTRLQALAYQTQFGASGTPKVDDDTPRRELTAQRDQVTISPQGRILSGQSPHGPSPFKALADALASGDLAAAREAYALIDQRIQARRARQPDASGLPDFKGFENGPLAPMFKDLAALGQALAGGDITQAKQAFATLLSNSPRLQPQTPASEQAHHRV